MKPARLKSQINTKDDELIRRCLNNDRKAQKKLYERFGPVMKVVCLRYLFEKQLAEEIMNRGFYKVFTKLDQYSSEGSFEGWIRRIMVNECLNQNKLKRIKYEIDTESEERFLQQVPEVEANHGLNHIMAVIASLPDGYRMVFNLAEIEGYNHDEIGEELGITASSSRSQLSRAKKLLRQKLKNIEGI